MCTYTMLDFRVKSTLPRIGVMNPHHGFTFSNKLFIVLI